MPDVNEFLTGFGLNEGEVFNGYEIGKISATRKQIVRWNEYSYDVSLILLWKSEGAPKDSDINKALGQLSQHVDGIRIIRTESGRPYKVVLLPGDKPVIHENGTIIGLDFQGFAKRIGEAEAEEIISGQKGW